MKGQAQAVTAVLITSVIVGAIATSYTWGVPLLEKQQGQAELERTQQNVLNLYDRIVEVSESGEGTTARVDLTDGISASNINVRVNEQQNYIDVVKRGSSQNPPYPFDTWTLVRGNSMQNLSTGSGAYARSGEDLPGAVTVRPSGSPDSSTVIYRIEFRNILSETPSGTRLSRINLTAEGQTRSTGETTLFVSNQGVNWERGNDAVTLPSEERVPRQNTEITVGFR
ncbi:MAG: hypothetical protein ACI8Z7_000678 [Candidatus Nanohaloarchaea archaeon]|jgi:hypothetical protein